MNENDSKHIIEINAHLAAFSKAFENSAEDMRALIAAMNALGALEANTLSLPPRSPKKGTRPYYRQHERY